jgi:hypothetical protein
MSLIEGGDLPGLIIDPEQTNITLLGTLQYLVIAGLLTVGDHVKLTAGKAIQFDNLNVLESNILSLYDGITKDVVIQSGGVSYINNPYNFGLGRFNPTYKFHVQGDGVGLSHNKSGELTVLIENTSATGSSVFRFLRSTDYDWRIKGNSSSFKIRDHQNSRNIITILKSNGNIGIRNDSPQAPFDATPTTPGADSASRPFPSLTTTQQDALISLVAGCGNYNSVLKALFIHNGTELEAQAPDQTRHVYRNEDLPTAVAGKIELVNGLKYVLGGANKQLTLTDELIIPPQTLVERINISTNSTVEINGEIDSGTIDYTGTGTAIRSRPAQFGNILIGKLIISANSATIFDINATTPPGILLAEKISILGTANSLGTINGIKMDIATILVGSTITQGLNINNGVGTAIQRLEISGGATAPTCLFCLGGTAHSAGVFIRDIIFNNNGTGVYAFLINSATAFTNINVSGGEITDRSKAFDPAGKDKKDPGIIFHDVRGISNSTVFSEINIKQNAFVTSYPAINAWTEINIDPTKITSLKEERMLFSGVEDEYLGEEPQNMSNDATATVSTGGVNKEYFVSFARRIYGTTSVTFDNATNTVQEAGNTRANGDSLRLNTDGTLPAELSIKHLYFVINRTASTYQLSYTAGGAAVTFTDNGTGNHSYNLMYLVDADDSEIISTGSPKKLKPSSVEELNDGDRLTIMSKTATTPLAASTITDLYIKKIKA